MPDFTTCNYYHILFLLQRVKQFYQDANLGPTISDVQFTATVSKPMINPSIKAVSKGWNVVHNGLKKVCNELMHYNNCDNYTD